VADPSVTELIAGNFFFIVLVMFNPKPSKEPEVDVNSNKQPKVDVKLSKIENNDNRQSSKKSMVVKPAVIFTYNSRQLECLLYDKR
jgi:hypothetical protein